MPLLSRLLALVFFAALACTARAALISIETVTVGDAGNAAYNDQFGSVSYEFNIGKYEVTIDQYTTFLNSVASVTSDGAIVNLWNSSMGTTGTIRGISRSGSGTLANPYSYSVIGTGNRPISYISWFDAARFANWVNNGATNGASTETGAYTLNGATSGNSFNRNPGATWYLPSQNEWFKAAFYKGGGTNAGYWQYPTMSDTAPGNVIGATANQANYRLGNIYSVTQTNTFNNSTNYLTTAGAFTASASPYGTFDQAGNVQEWTEGKSGANRLYMGGRWSDTSASAMFVNTATIAATPTTEDPTTGFRLASASASSVPEPGTWAAAALLAGGAAFARWRKRAKVA